MFCGVGVGWGDVGPFAVESCKEFSSLKQRAIRRIIGTMVKKFLDVNWDIFDWIYLKRVEAALAEVGIDDVVDFHRRFWRRRRS